MAMLKLSLSSPMPTLTLDSPPLDSTPSASAAGSVPRHGDAHELPDFSRLFDFARDLNSIHDTGDRIMISDWGADDFAPESINFSTADPGEPRIVEFESDSDSDDQIITVCEDVERSGDDTALCWDCLRIEDERRDEEFDWEEVGGFDEETARNVDWEVLVENYGDDHDGFVYTSDYDVVVGQFAELKGTPPAAKSVVEMLPCIVMTEEDVGCKNNVCAVCKDEIAVEEKAKRLPCSHHYHEECILHWLGIRNSCPLCRYELPTDDREYENWKLTRADVSVEEERLRYDFELVNGMIEIHDF